MGVVVATCIGSGMEVMDQGGSYDFAVIDEASQALEPATLVALERAGPDVKHVVLIGDHKQLPATVLSSDPNIGVSLFQRMADKGVDPLMLLEQRRMHSLIAQFPNETFYNGRLINATDDTKLQPCAPASTVQLHHVSAQDVNGNEVKRGESTCNQIEAEALVSYLEQYVDTPAGEDISIGVLTPYAAQKGLLNDLLVERGLLRDHIRVDTIDGFQGMEKDIILFSATRSNARGDLGFLRDPRRMNVMLTRAKRSLVVFCDAVTLRSSIYASHWARWVSFVQEQGVVTGDALPAAMSSDFNTSQQGGDFGIGARSGFSSFQDEHDTMVSIGDQEVPESDFLKMLKSEHNVENSADAGQSAEHSTCVTLSESVRPVDSATFHSGMNPMNENDLKSNGQTVREYHNDESNPHRRQDDLSTRNQYLSEEDFSKLLEDESFGTDPTHPKGHDPDFLAMLDKCAADAAKN